MSSASANSGTLNRRWFIVAQRMTEWWLRVCWGLAIRGSQHIPRTGAFVIAANHSSYFDPMIVGAAFHSRPGRPIAREALFRVPLLGRLLYSLGCVPLSQESNAAAIRLAIVELQAGRPVAVYPEGLRTWDGTVGPFQRGFEVLAKRAQVPIIPVGIAGAYEIWPRTRPFPRAGGKLRCVIGEPISPSELLAAPEGATEHLRNRVLELINIAQMWEPGS